ncbi:MAG: GNAT family N-acetyltransferase [Acidimicrobiales bacterium]
MASPNLAAVAIREAQPGDLGEIVALIRALGDYEKMAAEIEFDRADIGRWLFGPDPPARVLLATDPTGAVAGMALYYVTFSTFLGRPGIWLEDLFVRPEHRGRGHGGELLRALRQRTEGRVEWSVLDWNQPAIDFYRSIGAAPLEGWTRYRWSPTSGREASPG